MFPTYTITLVIICNIQTYVICVLVVLIWFANNGLMVYMFRFYNRLKKFIVLPDPLGHLNIANYNGVNKQKTRSNNRNKSFSCIWKYVSYLLVILTSRNYQNTEALCKINTCLVTKILWGFLDYGITIWILHILF